MDIDTNPLIERRAYPTAQLEIDEAILEYLVYNATKAVLRDFQKSGDSRDEAAREQKVDTHLDLVDSFLVMFRTMHPYHLGSPEIQLRIRLLRFSTLFTKRQSARDLRRWTQKLQELRSHRYDKAHAFKCGLDLPDLTEYLGPFEDLKRIKHEYVVGHRARDRPARQDTSLPLVSFLDTLPSFMALSAAENAMQESKITATWMRLAAGYMAQAVVEEYLVYGSRRNEILEQAFAWGFDPDMVAGEQSDDWMVNAMFLDEEAQFEDWYKIRDEHLRALIPPAGSDLLDHFKSLRENELSLSTFEHCIIQFLEGLLHSLPSPSLVQTASGKIEDTPLSRNDTRTLQGRIGIA